MLVNLINLVGVTALIQVEFSAYCGEMNKSVNYQDENQEKKGKLDHY